MVTIEKQVEVLNHITQVMRDSVGSDYVEMRCRFDYFNDDGDWSAESQFSYLRDGKWCHALLKDTAGNVYRLVHLLHELMKSHTGGDWKNFVLEIDPSGRAHTKFTY